MNKAIVMKSNLNSLTLPSTEIERPATGYAHAQYARALSEFGFPLELSASQAWYLRRTIPASPYSDAMGCYPLFSCRDWRSLRSDLDSLGDDVVSFSVVADPFGDHDEAYLKECFRDLVVPFKSHFVSDLTLPREKFVSAHHRRNARQALGRMEVEVGERPEGYLSDWISLYARLIERHNLSGFHAFSRASFARQLETPGVVALRAIIDDEVVGMLLWFTQGDVAYYHLGAFSDKGYSTGASFALFWTALDYFRSAGCMWVNLGAGAGSGQSVGGEDGLARFKRGWATGERTVYFCGRIYDPARYAELVEARGASDTGYFPRYRAGEFR